MINGAGDFESQDSESREAEPAETRCDFCKTVSVQDIRYMGKLPYSTTCPTCKAQTGYTTRKKRKLVIKELRRNSHSRFYVVANWLKKLLKDIKE